MPRPNMYVVHVTHRHGGELLNTRLVIGCQWGAHEMADNCISHGLQYIIEGPVPAPERSPEETARAARLIELLASAPASFATN